MAARGGAVARLYPHVVSDPTRPHAVARSAVLHASDAGETPLFDAVKGGALGAVQLLLAHSASATQVETKGKSTPLHHAASLDQVDIMRELISKGATGVRACVVRGADGDGRREAGGC